MTTCTYNLPLAVHAPRASCACLPAAEECEAALPPAAAALAVGGAGVGGCAAAAAAVAVATRRPRARPGGLASLARRRQGRQERREGG